MRQTPNRGRVIAMGVLLGIVLFLVGVVIILRPTIGPYHDYATERPCLTAVYEDTNGNGKIDSGENDSPSIPIQIVVDDENGFANNGRFTRDKCFLTAGRDGRSVSLRFILPPDFKMTASVQNGVYSTSPDVLVLIPDAAHFADSPPNVAILVQHTSAATSTP